MGESHYQPALEWAAGGRTPDGCKRRLVTAELVREPFNKHDGNAVRVDIGGATVGYLPRDVAPHAHAIIESLWRVDRLATCRATLTGGWDRGWRDKGSIGVILDAAYPPAAFDAMSMAALPEGQRVSVTNEEHYQESLRKLLGRAQTREAISTLRLVERDPHRSTSGPAIEVRTGTAVVGHLTPKMSERYAPLLEHAARWHLPATSRTRLERGGDKIEVFVRLPDIAVFLGRG